MRNFGVSITVLLASLTMLAGGAGCAAADGSAPSDATEAASAEALATASAGHLSQDLICAAVGAADENSQGEGLVTIPQSKLKGDALHDFKSWQRNMVPDYPSQAFELPVKLHGKTYSFVMVIEQNDGGGSVGVYRTDGSVVATDEYSESEGNPWSSPADKCPEPS